MTQPNHHLNTTFAALADPTQRAILARLTSDDAGGSRDRLAAQGMGL
ncbi:MAG: hypothetical protein ABSC94_23820 [Polyangiaceae bacterium]|jgi:hypothetical protein